MTTFMFKIFIITLWLSMHYPVYDAVDPMFYTRETVVIWVEPSTFDGSPTHIIHVMDGQHNIFEFYDDEDYWKDGDICEVVQWDYNNYEILSTERKGSLWNYDNNKHFTNVQYPEGYTGEVNFTSY